MKRLFFYCLFFCACTFSIGQQKNTDSLKINAANTLDEVVVTAFQSKIKWKDAPMAVAFINQAQLQNISVNTVLPSLNSVTGVRVEERSPASYRISIRGSTLRSPFGVRNVKVYWNDIPLSDGGGNTYINLVEMNQLNGVEIIKGPSGSVYGSGTGGVILLKSNPSFLQQQKNNFTASVSGGSFGLLNENVNWSHQQKNFSMSVQQTHQQADGYRIQSASRKEVIKWDAQLSLKNHQLQFLFFYTNLFYQTPGGLTKVQMLQNPMAARLASGTLPGAVQQQTAIYNETVFAGINDHWTLNKDWNIETVVMANHTAFKNPFITNYELRDETNSGLRTNIQYHHAFNNVNTQWTTGAEWLSNHSHIDDYGNRSGVKDTVQFKDDVFANQWFVFSQLQLIIGKLNFSSGVSLNNQLYNYKRFTDPSFKEYVHSNNTNVLTPRFAISYPLNKNISLYMLAAKGFSPPSLAEIHPSDGLFHSELKPEYGWNEEAGIKGSIFHQRFSFDLAFYYFNLNDAIVSRNNAAGNQYFVNAGGAEEKGIELFMQYQLLKDADRFFKSCKVFSSYSYQPYYFSTYYQGTNNYSGHQVTGVPQNIFVAGIETQTVQQFYLNVLYNAVSSIPLTDANDEYANACHLLQFKFGKYWKMNKIRYHVFLGGDNLLNELYSLGNDINAAGRRFYNPAATRNFYAGINLSW